jgi:tryptophan synthase alpha chain
MNRIQKTFEKLKQTKTPAFISFLMAGDPNVAKSLELIKGLPSSGVDIIEIGVPFTDPMADGTSIQLAGQRALKAGMTLEKVLKMVAEFRSQNNHTPIILMGYFNPIFSMGVNNFLSKAVAVGVDGLIIVDLPPEEDEELCLPCSDYGINFIRLLTPTSDDARLDKLLKQASGFLYYVSITGITGSHEAEIKSVAPQINRIKKKTTLPVCVGFGIKNKENANAIAQFSDGVVVGSAIVDKIASGESSKSILNFCAELANATHKQKDA